MKFLCGYPGLFQCSVKRRMVYGKAARKQEPQVASTADMLGRFYSRSWFGRCYFNNKLIDDRGFVTDALATDTMSAPCENISFAPSKSRWKLFSIKNRLVGLAYPFYDPDYP